MEHKESLKPRSNPSRRSPLQTISDIEKEAALSEILSRTLGHPTTIRIVSSSYGGRHHSISLEIEAPSSRENEKDRNRIGLEKISDESLANLFSESLSDLVGVPLRVLIKGRSYSNRTGLHGPRAKPIGLRIAVFDKE